MNAQDVLYNVIHNGQKEFDIRPFVQLYIMELKG